MTLSYSRRSKEFKKLNKYLNHKEVYKTKTYFAETKVTLNEIVEQSALTVDI